MNTLARLALLPPLALIAACQQNAPAPDAAATTEASAPAAKTSAATGITVSDGKLVLPAVKGHPGAAYFVVSNSGIKPVVLTGVAIEGAGKAEMHETRDGQMASLASVPVPAGDMVLFERGGKHVMVFDLPATLAAGGSTEMTLTFASGAKVSLPLAVEAAGGGSTMDHGAMDHGAMR